VEVRTNYVGFYLSICLVCAIPLSGQNVDPEIPSHFKLDIEMAARLRPELESQSTAAAGKYTAARLVFERLAAQVAKQSNAKITWHLRIVEDGRLNALSSPDGTVYVEDGLADLAGPSTGLWAAVLSHEIAHVVRRDWARRYLFEKYLASGGGSIILGDSGLPPAGTFSDSEKASADFGRFCQRMELEADREGLMLMARAGYHPDFVPALHHLLHARENVPNNASVYAMHPCWEERDHELSRAYTEASIDFEHRWPEWYASPGGNPPVVVFAEEPTIKKTGAQQWQVQIPMRCQNLAGAVEVVLRADGPSRGEHLDRVADAGDRPEARQLTGCTSPRTTVVFNVAGKSAGADAHWTDVYVVDAWGAVLARAVLPKIAH